jgi:long-chain acyl-CoA synthetase
VQGVIVEDADWTKNGFLTSSGKVKRREVKKKHEKAIDELMKKL